MTTIEIVILIILALCLAWGYKKGVVVQLGSLLSFAIAIAACQIFGDAASDAVLAIIGHKPPEADASLTEMARESMAVYAAKVIGHTVLFLLVWLGVWLASRTVRFMAKSVHLGFIDAAAGALFMALKGALIMSIIVNFAKFVAPESGLATNDGPIIGGVADFAPMLLGFIQNS